MIQTVTNIDVDLSTPKYICANLKQGDNGTRSFVIQCRENGIPISIDSDNAYAILKLKKPDGTYVLLPCAIMEDGRISFTLVDSVTTKPGRCVSEVVIYEKTESNTGDYKELDSLPAGKSIATMDMVFNVFPSSIDNCELETSNDFSAVNDLMAKILRDYKWILDENHGIIGSVKTINGRKPDEEGAFFLEASDCQGYIDDSLVEPKNDISTLKEKVSSLEGENSDRINEINELKGKDLEIEENIQTLNGSVVKSINTVLPDDSGNVSLTPENLGAVSKTGDTMSGALSMSGNAIRNISSPVNNSDAANKGYVDNAVNSISTIYKNVVVATSSWQSDGTYANFPYKASISVGGATGDSYPEIVFNPNDTADFTFAGSAVSRTGYVDIFCEDTPSRNITIQTIILWNIN